MGIEYDLVDRTNYRVFELGKWFIDDELFTKAQGLENFVDEALQDYEDEDEKELTWRREQLKRIWAFLVVADWNVIVLGDNQCGGRHEKGPTVELSPIYDDNDVGNRHTGRFDVIFDSERPSDVGKRKYALVATVHTRTAAAIAEIGPIVLERDPCEARQREVEGWSALDRMRYLHGRSDVKDRIARRDRAEDVTRAIDGLIRAHVLAALGIDINDGARLAEIEEETPKATHEALASTRRSLKRALEARAKSGFSKDIAEKIADVVRSDPRDRQDYVDELAKLLERGT